MRNSLNRKPIVCLVLLTLLTLPLLAETQVSISVSENLLSVGDRVSVKVIIKTSEDIDQISVALDDGQYEIMEERPTQKREQSDYTVFEKEVILSFFKLGDFNIGPFTVSLFKNDAQVDSKKTNSVPVTVKTVLEEQDKDIKELKSPIDIKGDPFYVLKYVILALAAGILIGLLIAWWRRRNKETPEPEIALTPLEELEKRIKDLWDLHLFDKGKIKLHFIELTRISKHFLFRNYGFQAEDFTTYETMNSLQIKEKETVLLDYFRFIFNTADLVKFAKFIPDAPVLDEVLEKINAIIVKYKLRLAPTLPKEEQ